MKRILHFIYINLQIYPFSFTCQLRSHILRHQILQATAFKDKICEIGMFMILFVFYFIQIIINFATNKLN